MANSVVWAAVAESITFQRRVRLFLCNAALTALNESSANTCHSNRAIYAQSILGGNADIRIASYTVMTDSTLRSDADVEDTSGLNGISDANLYSAVNSSFDFLAGCDKST